MRKKNLPLYERARLALRLKPVIAERAKKRQGTRTDLNNIPEKLPECKDSRDILGKMAGVSGKTYEHAVKVIEQATPETKEALRRTRR